MLMLHVPYRLLHRRKLPCKVLHPSQSVYACAALLCSSLDWSVALVCTHLLLSPKTALLRTRFSPARPRRAAPAELLPPLRGSTVTRASSECFRCCCRRRPPWPAAHAAAATCSCSAARSARKRATSAWARCSACQSGTSNVQYATQPRVPACCLRERAAEADGDHNTGFGIW